MKPLKSLLLSAVSLLLGYGAVQGQTTTMSLHMTDGTVHTFNYSDIDSLVINHAVAGSDISVEVSGIKATSATISVTSPDPELRYYFDLCTEDAYNRNGGRVGAMVEKFISDMAAQYPQLTQQQILDAMLDSGDVSEQIRQLPADTEMVVYVVPVDDNGSAYGQPAIARFRTLEAGDPAKCTFELAAEDVTSDGLLVRISPSDASVKYWYGLVVASGYPGDYAVMADVRETFGNVAANNQISVSELVNRVAYSDNLEQIESGLQPNTSYYLYVYALNSDATNAGPMTKIQFTTREYDLSDAEIALSYRYFDGNELYNIDPTTYERYRNAVMVEAHVTPNEIAAHWAVGLGRNDMTDPETYPDTATKQALMSGGGRLDLTGMNFVAAWGEATFVYFAADAAGVDGQLKRLLVNFTPEGASPVDALSDKAPSVASMSVRASVPTFHSTPSGGTIMRLNKRIDSTMHYRR